MQSFLEVIDALGGTGKLASAINEKYPTVAAWKQRNSIPGEYWAVVADAAKKAEIRLTVQDLANIAQTKRTTSEAAE